MTNLTLAAQPSGNAPPPPARTAADKPHPPLDARRSAGLATRPIREVHGARLAYAAASSAANPARVVTPSFRYTAARCVSTVFTDRNSS